MKPFLRSNDLAYEDDSVPSSSYMLTYSLAGLPRSFKTAAPYDPTVGPCLGLYVGPRGVGVFLSARHPCRTYSPPKLAYPTAIPTARALHAYLARTPPPLLGPYSRTLTRVLWWSWGGAAVSDERGTPVDHDPALRRAHPPLGGPTGLPRS